jgi:hypothetical protein
MKPAWTHYLKGKRRKRGEMNATEAKYAAHLEGQKLLGGVLWFAFEGVTLRLAKDMRYTPDFIVQVADGMLEIHEVKGFWGETGRLKIKMAANLFPFRFRAFRAKAKKDGGGWAIEEFE